MFILSFGEEMYIELAYLCAFNTIDLTILQISKGKKSAYSKVQARATRVMITKNPKQRVI